MLCAEALVEGFRQYPAQRSAVVDDIMGAVLPNLPTGKGTQRAFLIGDEEQLRTQMVSALILQLVQVSSDYRSSATIMSVFYYPQPIWQGWGICMTLGADTNLTDSSNAAFINGNADACCSSMAVLWAGLCAAAYN